MLVIDPISTHGIMKSGMNLFIFVNREIELSCVTICNNNAKQIKTQLCVEPWAKCPALAILWHTGYAVCHKPGALSTSWDRKRWKERELRGRAIITAKNSHKGPQVLVYVHFPFSQSRSMYCQNKKVLQNKLIPLTKPQSWRIYNYNIKSFWVVLLLILFSKIRYM